MEQSNPKNYLESEKKYFGSIEAYFNESSGTFAEKMHCFPRFVPRQALSYFLARAAIYKQVISVHGSIMDFGIYRGSSFFTWQQLSAILEPYNHIRKIIGFDSFEGFSDLGKVDVGTEGDDLKLKKKGGMAFGGSEEIQKGINLLSLNRPIGHIDKSFCIKGVLPGACKAYLEEHQETVVALANFGLGLYEPTLELLKLIRPRLVKGSVLVFEELNQGTWPGETKAFLEVFGSLDVTLNREPCCPHVSWIKIGS